VAERVCLYALVAGRGRALRLDGVAGERLYAVDLAGVEGVVGVVPRAIRATTAAMRRYDAIQRELTAVYASVLPARFGTCAATADELAASVRDRQAAIRRALHLVRRRVQMTVRLFAGAPDSGAPAARRPRARGPSPGSARRGTLYLRARAVDASIPGSDALRRAVARWVRAERTERHMHGRLAGSLYHLVPRTAVGPYRRALERAALEARLTTIVSGPWPPYAFAE
jgi:hypothetical protein